MLSINYLFEIKLKDKRTGPLLDSIKTRYQDKSLEDYRAGKPIWNTIAGRAGTLHLKKDVPTFSKIANWGAKKVLKSLRKSDHKDILAIGKQRAETRDLTLNPDETSTIKKKQYRNFIEVKTPPYKYSHAVYDPQIRSIERHFREDKPK